MFFDLLFVSLRRDYPIETMKLRFSINYTTAWGESLHVMISYRQRNGKTKHQNLQMQTQTGEWWYVETTVMESRQNPILSMSYHYQVEAEDGYVLRREWNMVKRTFPVDSSKNYVFDDVWRDVPLTFPLYTKVMYATKEKEAAPIVEMPNALYRKTVIFDVAAPQLQKGEALAVCGSHPTLGDWNPSRYLMMHPMGDDQWRLTVNVDNVSLPIAYKYVVVDTATHELKAWEEGDNRIVGGDSRILGGDKGYNDENISLSDGTVLVLQGHPLRVKERSWKCAGISIPLFSLRSEHSFGVGDMGDLKRLVDWASLVGMKVIQLLPLNDTTSMHSWTDSQPYNAISLRALHPHYLDLEQMPELKDKQAQGVFQRQRRELNALEDSDYMAVDRVKTDYINKVYEESGEEVLTSEAFYTFFKANESWLLPYAFFCALRDKFGTAHYEDWPQYATYQQRDLMKNTQPDSPLYAHIRKTYFVQYHLHTQLLQASQYAHQKGVALKCDIPVGVYRDSVETWTNPTLFNMEMQMGTPPSRDELMGQNWGFPPMRDTAEAIAFQHELLLYWQQFFDVVRLDHVVSHFRIWEIPRTQLFADMGHYMPALPMSEEEIGRCGLAFRRELFTRPFINDHILEKLFGVHAPYVRETFLQKKAYHLYDLREEYDTQVKVQRFFEGRNDENSQWIRDGLYRLIANVLFLEDPYQPEMYHPRYGVFNAPVFDILTAEEKNAFMTLYNDYFFLRHNDFWRHRASRRFDKLLEDVRMLACAEDLGLLPDCVHEVLDEQRMLTLEVQRMPKDSEVEFGRLSAYPYRSVATISTHDMAPLRQWWEEFPGRTQRYFATMMQKEGRAPKHLPAHLAEELIARHLYGPSMMCILSLQDWLAMSADLRRKDPWSERINAPFDPYNQWKYRMHLTLEQLMTAQQYNGKVRQMIERSKRL